MINNKLDPSGIKVPGLLKQWFGRRSSRGYDAQRLPNRVLPNALEIYEQLKAEFANIVKVEKSSTSTFPQRVEFAIAIDRRIVDLCDELTLSHAHDGLALAEQPLALRAGLGTRVANLHTRLALMYRNLLEEGRKKYPSGSRGDLRLKVVACRAMMALGRAMKWHYFAGHQEPEALWGRMYRLYRFAEKREFLRFPVELAKGSQTTFHAEFVRNLLFGMIEPEELSPPMIDAAFHFCGEWTDLVLLQPADAGTGAQHCVDLMGSVPPSQFHPQMSAERIRCFSTAAVCFKAAALREAMHRRQLSETAALADGQLSPQDHELLIRNLMRSWVKARPARRGERKSPGPTVARVAVGVSAITELLQTHAHPESGIPEELSFEHWAVDNESTQGYGLRRRNIVEEPEPGKLVCLRANGSPIWQLGVVRWDKDATTGEPLLGVETLAENPRIVQLSAGPGEKSRPLAAGSHAALNGRNGGRTSSADVTDIDGDGPMQALLLPKDLSRGQSSTLILPERVYPVGTVLKISSDHAQFWIRLSGLMDYNDHWARMTFAVMGRV